MSFVSRRMMMLTVILLFAALAFSQGNKPQEGYVPDSETAVKIAEAVLMPIYGKKHIESERPFVAKLKDGIWM